ncbi:MAG: hypothetical protein ACI88H_003569, partial [Cocleimonas sp.]
SKGTKDEHYPYIKSSAFSKNTHLSTTAVISSGLPYSKPTPPHLSKKVFPN